MGTQLSGFSKSVISNHPCSHRTLCCPQNHLQTSLAHCLRKPDIRSSLFLVSLKSFTWMVFPSSAIGRFLFPLYRFPYLGKFFDNVCVTFITSKRNIASACISLTSSVQILSPLSDPCLSPLNSVTAPSQPVWQILYMASCVSSPSANSKETLGAGTCKLWRNHLHRWSLPMLLWKVGVL